MSVVNNEFYQTIDRPGTAEFTDRGSRFLAYTYPITSVTEFKDLLAALKKEHPKAVHHCFAYRIGLDGTQYRVSDDGEPSGTAGRPILGQIDSRGLTNILIVVVRYFGGTLLGVPGLINAYKSAAALALQLTPAVQKPVLVNYRLQFDHTQTHAVMQVIKHFSCPVYKQEAQLFCLIEAGIPKHRLDEVLFRLRDIRGVELEKIA